MLKFKLTIRSMVKFKFTLRTIITNLMIQKIAYRYLHRIFRHFMLIYLSFFCRKIRYSHYGNDSVLVPLLSPYRDEIRFWFGQLKHDCWNYN